MPNILSQDEIDSLLGAMERGEIDESAVKEQVGSLSIADYNFRRPNLITKEQLRNFNTVHETLAKEMESALALMLRNSTEFSLVSTEQQQYGEFIGSLSNVSHSVVFTADPLPGMAIVEVNLALVFGVVDMLLGGQGNVETEIRIPTDIEVAIIHPFIEKLLEKLAFCWNSFIDVDLKVKRTESNPEYIQAAPVDAPVVVLAFDAKIGNANGIINICYPLPMIQAANDELDSGSGQMDSYYGKKDDDGSRSSLIRNVLDIPMPISVELGTASVRGSQLSHLQPGDVIVLDQLLNSPLTMYVSGRPVFNVYPGKGKEGLVVRVGNHVSQEVDRGPEVNVSI